MTRTGRLSLLGMSVLVATCYALPLIEGYWRHHRLIHVFYPDEAYYGIRVLDAYRGGTLGNPYLAGHEGAPRYLPEATERLLAGISRIVALDPLTLLAICRVALPLLLFLSLWRLALALGIENRTAIAAAAALPLIPPILTLVQPPGTGQHGFLRLFRSISPVTHLLLLALALLSLVKVWRMPALRDVCVSGLLVGALFYTPIYYWSFAIGGTLLLALGVGNKSRRALFGVVAIAFLVGLPPLIHSHRLMSVPSVVETLERWTLMVPGRWAEIGVGRRSVENVAVLGMLWLWRRKFGESGRFLVAFCLAGELLLFQNAITNRQIQSFHFMHCLFLIWPLAGALFWQTGCGGDYRPTAPILVAFTALLLTGAGLAQLIAFENWEGWREEAPSVYTLDLVMPRTLRWLDEHTPPGSVVIASEEVMASLPLFTHNKVYWARYAGQHVLSNHEVAARSADAVRWLDDPAQPLHYRADFALHKWARCATLTGFLYRDAAEGTCIVPERNGAPTM